jgi:hypothetical protein
MTYGGRVSYVSIRLCLIDDRQAAFPCAWRRSTPSPSLHGHRIIHRSLFGVRAERGCLAGLEDQKYNQGMLLLRSSCSTRDSRSGGGARPTQGHDHSVVLFFFLSSQSFGRSPQTWRERAGLLIKRRKSTCAVCKPNPYSFPASTVPEPFGSDGRLGGGSHCSLLCLLSARPP